MNVLQRQIKERSRERDSPSPPTDFQSEVKPGFKQGCGAEKAMHNKSCWKSFFTDYSNIKGFHVPQKYLSERKTKLTFYVSSVLTNT